MTSSRRQLVAAVTAAAIAGPLAAIGIGSAGAARQTVTLGNVTGTPTTNISTCFSTCTFLPFSSISNPELQVPFDGTVTSFSVNAGSSGGTASLRVLRPAPGGQFTGAGTGPQETLALDINTFAVNIPVKAGDLLALDNSSSALLFDTSSTTPITAYFAGGLGDGHTATPQTQGGHRLLLSATVQASGTTTGGATTTGGTTTQPTTTTSTTTTTVPVRTGLAPTLSRVGEAHHVWREGKTTSGRSRQPLGTTFSFTLSAPARVSFTFTQQLAGRKVRGTCVAQSRLNRTRPACKRVVTLGSLSFGGRAGMNRVSFQGRLSRTKKLLPGRYTLLIDARNSAGKRSATAQLAFTIAS